VKRIVWIVVILLILLLGALVFVLQDSIRG